MKAGGVDARGAHGGEEGGAANLGPAGPDPTPRAQPDAAAPEVAEAILHGREPEGVTLPALMQAGSGGVG